MNHICNAFSLNMVMHPCTLKTRVVQPADVPADAVSAVGHASTAAVLSALLNRPVLENRTVVTLGMGDRAFAMSLKTADGKPFRAPEGKVLSVEDLGALRVEIVEVAVD